MKTTIRVNELCEEIQALVKKMAELSGHEHDSYDVWIVPHEPETDHCTDCDHDNPSCGNCLGC